MRYEKMSDDVWVAYRVARLAKEFGLPPGNLWEPPTVRWVSQLLAEVRENPEVSVVSPRDFVAHHVRVHFGAYPEGE